MNATISLVAIVKGCAVPNRSSTSTFPPVSSQYHIPTVVELTGTGHKGPDAAPASLYIPDPMTGSTMFAVSVVAASLLVSITCPGAKLKYQLPVPPVVVLPATSRIWYSAESPTLRQKPVRVPFPTAGEELSLVHVGVNPIQSVKIGILEVDLLLTFAPFYSHNQ